MGRVSYQRRANSGAVTLQLSIVLAEVLLPLDILASSFGSILETDIDVPLIKAFSNPPILICLLYAKSYTHLHC